jgi:hypothetical protein
MMKSKKRFGRLLGLVLMAALVIPTVTVSAHTRFPAGPYTVEVGWLNEPPVAGQPNAIVVNLSAGDQAQSVANTPQPAASQPAAPVKIDYSGLTLQVSYGGQTKMLPLEPQREDTPDNLMGVMTPAVMGKYTVQIRGKLNGDLGSTAVSISTQPEEVVGPDAVEFPNLSAEQAPAQTGSGGMDWMPVAGLAAGALGIILAIIALLRK